MDKVDQARFEVSGGGVRVQLNNGQEVRQGVVPVLEVALDHTQVVEGPGITGINLNRFLKSFTCAGQIAFPEEGVAEVVMGRGEFWVQGDGPAKSPDRLVLFLSKNTSQKMTASGKVTAISLQRMAAAPASQERG